MKAAWDEVKRLHDTNATHRSGYRLQELDGESILIHASNELDELVEAHYDNAPEAIDELGDLLGAAIHYAVLRGWTQDQVEKAILRKLALRFTEGK